MSKERRFLRLGVVHTASHTGDISRRSFFQKNKDMFDMIDELECFCDRSSSPFY